MIYTSLESHLIWSFYIQYQVQGPRKKFRTKVQVKDIKQRFFKSLFFTFKSRYLCCVLPNKIIKNMHLQKGKISCGWSLQKPCHLIGWLHENFVFNKFSHGKTDKVSGTSFMLSSVLRRPVVLWVIWKHFAWICMGNN